MIMFVAELCVCVLYAVANPDFRDKYTVFYITLLASLLLCYRYQFEFPNVAVLLA